MCVWLRARYSIFPLLHFTACVSLLRFRIHQTLRLKSIEALDYFSSFLLPQKRRDAPWRSSERAQFFSCLYAFLLGLPFWKCGPSDCCNLRWTLFKRGLFEKKRGKEQFKTYFIKKALQSIDIPIDCSSIVFLQLHFPQKSFKHFLLLESCRSFVICSG